MNQEWKNCFDRDGVVFCQSFAVSLVPTVLEQLQRVLREVVPGMPPEHVFYEDKSDPASLKQLQRLQQHDAYFERMANQGDFPELAAMLLGESVTCKNVQYFNKPPGQGLATPPHQDAFYFKLDPPQALTMWLALDDVDQENGCVRYITGSHLHGMRPHHATGTLGFSQGIINFPNEVDALQEIPLPAAPGDLLAHHALTIHRADANRSTGRNRRALGLIYYGHSAQQDGLAWQKYQSDLRKDLLREGKI